MCCGDDVFCRVDGCYDKCKELVRYFLINMIIRGNYLVVELKFCVLMFMFVI